MRKIAITGGIGSGKSTVTDYLLSKGYTVIDADKMARKLTEPGGESIPYIVEHFGESFILPDGSMDRAKMRDLVFSNPDSKAVLERGTTDVVVRQIDEIIISLENKGETAVFFDIPLLFEIKKEKDYDEVWVVTSSLSVRRDRIIKRDGISSELADLIIGSQIDEDYRISKADYVINNSGSIVDLQKNLDKLLKNLN